MTTDATEALMTGPERFDVREISSATIPFDYRRNARIHRCFEIRHR